MNYVCIMSWQVTRNHFIHRLKEIYAHDEAENIFRLCIEHITGRSIQENFFNNTSFTQDQTDTLQCIIHRLLQHEPIQYILKESWFYDAPFYVNRHVLIPRPETEELVDWVIKENKHITPLTIIEVGTGSGCISITLKRKIPQAVVHSCDVSAAALSVARINAAKYNTPIEFLEFDFLDADNHALLPEADIIISNPPYIPQKDKAAMCPNVLAYEPGIALFVPDKSPAIFYEAIAASGTQLLHSAGKIYVEIHESMATLIQQVFKKTGYNTFVQTDMQGKSRMIRAEKINSQCHTKI